MIVAFRFILTGTKKTNINLLALLAKNPSLLLLEVKLLKNYFYFQMIYNSIVQNKITLLQIMWSQINLVEIMADT